MKRNILNGIPPAQPHYHAPPDNVLEMLQRTVVAQEGKLSALSEEVQQFRKCQVDTDSITKLGGLISFIVKLII